VDEVLSLSQWEAKARRRWSSPRLADTVALLLEGYGAKAVEVPGDFPLELADRLRERGIAVTPRPSPFLPERALKTVVEVAAIEEAQRYTEAALAAALEMLRESVVRGDEVLHRGRPLTSPASCGGSSSSATGRRAPPSTPRSTGRSRPVDTPPGWSTAGTRASSTGRATAWAWTSTSRRGSAAWTASSVPGRW